MAMPVTGPLTPPNLPAITFALTPGAGVARSKRSLSNSW